jgi:hypothetical protein
MSIAQTVDKAGEFAMKLKVSKRRYLLAKILKGSDGVEAVQGTLEGKMSIDAIQYLRPGIDDVQSLSPI